MKKLLIILVFCVFSIPMMGNSNPGSVTLHMIIFADTEDDNIGESCDVDYGNMEGLAEFISDNSDMDLKTYYVKAAANKKREMETVLDNLHVGTNDVVFFYYSGHGYRTTDSQSPYPRMYVLDDAFHQNDQGVSVEDVRTKIAAASPRLSIIMVDACNSMLDLKEPISGTSGEGNISAQLRRLFIDAEGEIVLCGSEAGDGINDSGNYTGYSWSNPIDGGYFTLNFRKAFEKSLLSNTPANWNTLLANTKQMTIDYSVVRLQDQLPGNKVQIPIYKYTTSK
ncbi:caspase family protein [Dokdonia sp.]|uniref:caspase family protein n=1 Tax=Dokdonia sp. TaxID=2024995 RepID=UPI0032654C68